MKIDSSVIVLTGAGSGIGRALAINLSSKGARLVLAGRNEKTLDDTRELLPFPDKALIFRADVTSAEDRKAMVEKVEQQFGQLNLLINNAGMVNVGRLKDASDEDLEMMVRTNLLGPMALCRDFLSLLKNGKPARIVNIGSMFGDIAFPMFTGYSATKFGLRGLSDALRRELKKDGIGVTYAAPRATMTNATAAFDHLVVPMKMILDDPEKVASHIVSGIEKDARSIYPKGQERLFVLVQRLFPGLVDKDIIKQLEEVDKES